MSSIKIRVGAALDANALTVYQPLIKASARARAEIDKNLNAAAKATAAVPKAAKTAGDALEQELEAMANKILKDEERSQVARTKVVERESKKRAKLEEQAKKGTGGDKPRPSRDDERARDRQLRDLSRAGAFGLGLARRGLSMGAGMAMGALQSTGLELALAPHMARAIDLQQRMVDVTNAGYIQGASGAAGQKQDAGKVTSEVRQAADVGAFGTNDVAEGLQKFVGLTGDLETGRSLLKSMATLARATGSDFVAMSEASAEVANHLGDVPDKAEKTAAVMRVIAGQGKLGALEIKDFSRQMAKIAANAPKFEGDIATNIGELGLMAQEAKLRGGASSAPMAATSVLAFATALSKKTALKHWAAAKDSKGHGLNPYTDAGHTTLRSPEELVLEALRYSKGDQTKINGLFGSVQAGRAVTGFANIYNETKGSQDDKIHAVADEFDRLRRAQLSAEEVQRAYSEAMQTTQTKVQVANNQLDEMASQLMTAMNPAIDGVMVALSDLFPVVKGLAEAMTDAIGSLTGATELGRQKGAFKAEIDALNLIGTIHGAEDAAQKGDPNHRSEAMTAVSRDRIQPLLDLADKRDVQLTDSIGNYQGTVNEEGKTFKGMSDAQIRDYAAGKGFAGRLEPEASKYLADKATLQRLHETLNQLHSERQKLIDAVTSGRMIVTVSNMPKGGLGPGGSDSGRMPANSPKPK